MPIAIQRSFLRTLNVLRSMQASVKKENGQTVLVPLFLGQESVVGEVRIDPVPGKKVEHTGVKIELLGQIELYFDRGSFYDFTSLVRELDVPGEILERKTYPFEFSTVEMQYESYNGVNVRLRFISVSNPFYAIDEATETVGTVQKQK
jgi:vacuolar protein sorting-associated protein 26